MIEEQLDVLLELLDCELDDELRELCELVSLQSWSIGMFESSMWNESSTTIDEQLDLLELLEDWLLELEADVDVDDWLLVSLQS